MKRPNRRKMHFVPKIVLETTFASVVPVCVAASACGGDDSNGAETFFGGDVADSTFADVRGTFFGGDVADTAFRDVRASDAGNPVDRSTDAAAPDGDEFTVADVECGPCGEVAADAFGSEGDVASDVDGDNGSPPPDGSDATLLSVADVGFGDAVADAAFGNPDGEAG
jgi:hypothetical protein